MKTRTLFTYFGLIIIVSLIVCFGVWKNISGQKIVNLQNQKVEVPESAKFFNTKNPFTIYLNLDTNFLPNYIESVAPNIKRKKAREESIKIRDTLFSLANLEYEKDLSSWIQPNLGFSFLEINQEENNYKWILALESNNMENANNFLTEFWEKKTLEGVSVERESYKNIEIISPLSNSINRNINTISTMLAEENLILIGSDSAALKQSIDCLSAASQNQHKDKALLKIVDKLQQGNGLFIISKGVLSNWFGIPTQTKENYDLERLIVSLRTTGSNLIIDSAFQFNNESQRIKSQVNEMAYLLNESSEGVDDIAIISEPFKIFSKNSQEPEAQLLGNHFREHIYQSGSTALKIIGSLEKGPLLWENHTNGWVVKTKKNPEYNEIIKSLEEANFTKKTFNIENKTIDVWLKINMERLEDYHSINTEIGTVLLQQDELNIWSNSIENIERSQEKDNFISQYQKMEDTRITNIDLLSQEIFLGANLASNELNKWRPWLLIQALIGKDLNANVKNLTIAIGDLPDEEHSLLNLRAKLTLG